MPRVQEIIEAPMGFWNWLLLGVAVLMIAAGFALLAAGDVVWSTTLLTLGYAVVIPIALLLKPKQKEKSSGS